MSRFDNATASLKEELDLRIFSAYVKLRFPVMAKRCAASPYTTYSCLLAGLNLWEALTGEPHPVDTFIPGLEVFLHENGTEEVTETASALCPV